MKLKRPFACLGKPKFRETVAVMPRPRCILDIGIANDSYLECKYVFPGAAYTGLDLEPPSFAMEPGDDFILRNLENEDALDGLQATYDLIIINHVLEHLNAGEKVFARLCQLLAPGGVLYAEFPSLRTAYTRKTASNYHFHDDPTHQKFYSLETLANAAIIEGCKVLSCGPISTPLKDVLAIPRALIGWVRGVGYGPFLLHTLRKIDHVMVRRGSSIQVGQSTHAGR
jgi:trans-aconitate methyltransferase